MRKTTRDEFDELDHFFDPFFLGFMRLEESPPVRDLTFPLRDFRDMYHMLQTEKPVWADWELYREEGYPEYDWFGWLELRTGTKSPGKAHSTRPKSDF
jgi:hypothetical protein